MSKQSKYIGIFREEAAEHLENLSLGLLELELKPGDAELIHELLRAAHTLKGSAKMLGLDHIGEIAHKMEDLFNDIEGGRLSISPETVDALLAGTDTIKDIVAQVGTSDAEVPDIGEVLTKLDDAIAGPAKPEKKEKPKKAKKRPKKKRKKAEEKEEKAEPAETEIAAEEEPVEEKVEEKPSEPEHVAQADQKPKPEETETTRRYTVQEKETIRVDTGKLDDLLNVAGELLLNKIKNESQLHRLETLIEKLDQVDMKAGQNGGSTTEAAKRLVEVLSSTQENLKEIYQDFSDAIIELDLYSQEIRNQTMGLRVLPARVLFDEFYRTVRDFARELKKEIRIEITGGETELDKQLLEELRPALVHIIRNSCDHGIESSEVRSKMGKPTGRREGIDIPPGRRRNERPGSSVSHTPPRFQHFGHHHGLFRPWRRYGRRQDQHRAYKGRYYH